jgi:hypothetical protein
MKFVSVIIILAYLTFPALCFGHPCDNLSTGAQQSCDAYAPSDNSPVEYDSDNCETSCCCAGHLPGTSTPPPGLDFSDKLLAYEPQLALPRVVYKIFVPPQNHPGITLELIFVTIGSRSLNSGARRYV